MTGIAFGVFDGLHEGHKYFLSKARTLCDELVVVLTAPEMVQLLKNHAPRLSYEDRVAALRSYDAHLQIVQSDKSPGAWSVFRGRESFIVILGYDQQGIARELTRMNVPFVFVDSHQPEKYKSSLLHGVIQIPIAKRVFDVVASTIVIVVLSPFVLLILLFALLEQVFSRKARGPLLYKETRISQGKPFTLYKIRTFKISSLDDAVKNGIVHTKRIEQNFKNLTITGMILIQVYLDEFPQLFLVLRGRMTFVGPRPTNPDAYASYVASGGRAKTMFKAGLTGRFQTHKSKKYGLDQEKEDLAYIDFVAKNSGYRVVLRDLLILAQTVFTLIRAEGI